MYVTLHRVKVDKRLKRGYLGLKILSIKNEKNESELSTSKLTHNVHKLIIRIKKNTDDHSQKKYPKT